MGMLGKVVGGAAVEMLGVAAAPVTGGVSLFVAGVVLGTAMNKDKKDKHIDEIKQAKERAFKDGVKEGKSRTVEEIQKFVNFYLATTALSYFAARCDGSISEEEKLEIDFDLDAIRKNCNIADGIKNKMIEISKNENLTWEEVVSYLDKVGIDTLERLGQDINEIITASDGVLPQEEKVRQDFDFYLNKRKNGDNVFNDGIVNALVVIRKP